MSIDIGITSIIVRTPQDFRSTYIDLSSERGELFNRRTELENELAEVRTKIAHLDEILNHLAPLGSIAWHDNEIASLGLTDAIRRTIEIADGEKVSAQDVRQRLIEKGYDLTGLSAPMSSIYKILSRLEKAGEIEQEKEDGRVFYKWKPSPISDEDIPF